MATAAGPIFHDYSEALDKVKFNQSLKKALPFHRSIVLTKEIDRSKLKMPVDVLKGKALRR